MRQTVGGSHYNWIGNNIKITHKSGKRCVSLSKNNSIIMIPVSVKPETVYKVSLTIMATSPKTNIIVNLFSNLSYDGPHQYVSIDNLNFKTIEVEVSSVNFPQNLPIYLRVFRPSTDAGAIFISSASIEEYGESNQNINLSIIDTQTNKYKAGVAGAAKKQYDELKLKEKQDMEIQKDISEKENILLAKNKNTVDDIVSQIKEVYKINKDDFPKVSIITISYNGKELLKACYESLINNTYYPNWEWVVGDNGSSDDSLEYLKSIKDSRLKVIARGHNNDNFSKANNDLIQYADGKYLVFLNNDTEPQPFWLIELVSKIEHNDDIGIVGPKLIYPDGRVQQAGIIFVPQGPGNVGFGLLAGYPNDHEKYDRFYQAVTGACLMIRKEDFLAVKGFNENYFWCYDDVELCLEIFYTLKKKVLYVANSLVIHKEHATLDKYANKGSSQGVQLFKNRWQRIWDVDINKYKTPMYNVLPTEISFISCVSDTTQYIEDVFGSLLRSSNNASYELIPIINQNNKYSATKALNIGIKKSKGKIIVLLHQDVIMYKDWIDDFLTCIINIEKKDKNWGVIGTAGVNERMKTIGAVYDINGNPGWGSTLPNITHPVQTVDEHLMAIRADSNLLFDENLPGFHFYGVDICLDALNKGMQNYGIYAPLTHHGSKSGKGSTISGKEEYMKIGNYVAGKWSKKFPIIKTSTCTISNGRVHTYLRWK